MIDLCRRKLRADVAATFPTLTSEQISEVVPTKEELNVIKLYTHKGEALTVYVNSRNPVLFEVEKTLYPTGTEKSRSGEVFFITILGLGGFEFGSLGWADFKTSDL